MTSRTFRRAALGVLLAGSACAVYAAMPRQHPMDPPTSAELGLEGSAATQWNVLHDATIDQRTSARAAVQRELDTLHTLLATDAPDLAAFNRQLDQQIDTRLAAMRELRGQKLALYEHLPKDQQARLRSVMRERLDRLSRLRALLEDAGNP